MLGGGRERERERERETEAEALYRGKFNNTLSLREKHDRGSSSHRGAHSRPILNLQHDVS